MSEAVEQEMARIRRRKTAQTFFNSMMGFGLAALSVAVVLLFALYTDTKDVAVAVVGETEQSLEVVCDAADDAKLTARAKQDCRDAREKKISERVAEVIDNPDPNDPEQQDPEQQDPEIQNPEIQDPEIPDSEVQDPELPDSETNDPDPVDDPDPDDPDPDDPEIQDPEVQDPEIQNAPVCPDGYIQAPFHYFGPDGVDGTGDEEDWILCKKVG